MGVSPRDPRRISYGGVLDVKRYMDELCDELGIRIVNDNEICDAARMTFTQVTRRNQFMRQYDNDYNVFYDLAVRRSRCSRRYSIRNIRRRLIFRDVEAGLTPPTSPSEGDTDPFSYSDSDVLME